MSQTDGSSSNTPDSPLLQVIFLLQVALLVGIVVVFQQFSGIPDRVAEVVPQGADNSGQIFELQSAVDALSAKVDALQATLDARASSAP